MRALIALRPARPRPEDSRRVCLVAVEDGASAFNSYLPLDDCDETVVARQDEGELPAEFSRRIISRIAVIERSARCIEQAVIAVGPSVDDQWMAARHLVARALLTHAHVSGAGASELVFAVHGDADVHLRHELMALVEILVGEPESSRTAIRVRFGPGNAGAALAVVIAGGKREATSETRLRIPLPLPGDLPRW